MRSGPRACPESAGRQLQVAGVDGVAAVDPLHSRGPQWRGKRPPCGQARSPWLPHPPLLQGGEARGLPLVDKNGRLSHPPLGWLSSGLLLLPHGSNLNCKCWTAMTSSGSLSFILESWLYTNRMLKTSFLSTSRVRQSILGESDLVKKLYLEKQD